MPTQKRIRLNGEYWQLKFVDLSNHDTDDETTHGFCDDPKKKRRAIYIDERPKKCELLEVLIHEMLHAVDWHKDEHSFIEPVARDIAKVLWSLGYRRSVVDGDEQGRRKAE